MARITCAISGIHFDCSYLADSNIPVKAGYFHPVFALNHKQLYKLYEQYSKGQLGPVDNYLLFCAFLNYTGHISWQHPVALNPKDAATQSMIANNIAQLVSVIERTSVIKHPSFKQPRFVVSYDTAYIFQIPNWIAAWEDNIERFQQGIATKRQRQSLQEVENKLSELLMLGEDLEKHSHIVANWAELAAEFPPNKAEEYKRVIRSCFNSRKMFTVDTELLKEIKDFCECNIDCTSLHFHTLSNVLREGVSRKNSYLGYALITPDGMTTEEKAAEETNQAHLELIAQDAPTSLPSRVDYPDSLSYIKARLAYRVAATLDSKAIEKEGL